jgi:hypothetical protein
MRVNEPGNEVYEYDDRGDDGDEESGVDIVKETKGLI